MSHLRRVARGLRRRIVGATPVWRAAHQVLRLDRVPHERTVPRAQLPGSLTHAIVLGAGVRPDGTVSAVLRERLLRAVEVAAARPALRVLVSGDGSSSAGHETAAMRDFLVAQGIDAQRVEIDDAGLSTRVSMQRAAARGIRHAVVVTNDFHLPRAVHVAVLAGIDAWTADDWTDCSYSDAHRPLRLDEQRERPAHVKDRLVLALRRAPAARPDRFSSR